jgi:hypothetical protein
MVAGIEKFSVELVAIATECEAVSVWPVMLPPMSYREQRHRGKLVDLGLQERL